MPLPFRRLIQPLSATINAAAFAGIVALSATATGVGQAAADGRGTSISDIAVPSIFPRRDRDALLEVTRSPTASAREQAIAWHGLAGQREEGAAHRAVVALSGLPESESDPMIAAYLGSAYVMKARDQSFVPARVRNVRKGLTLMREAVEASPGDFQIRALRAATTMNLPDMFDYRAEVESDMTLLIAQIENGAAPVTAGSPEHGRFVLALAKACAQDEDMACARTRLEEVARRFGADVMLTAPAAALTAALGH